MNGACVYANQPCDAGGQTPLQPVGRSGCSCRVGAGGSPAEGPSLLAALALALVLLARARRARG